MLVYLGVCALVLVVTAWMLPRPYLPRPVTKREESSILAGACPACSTGSIYEVSANHISTLWRCSSCKSAYLLTQLPGQDK